MAQTSLIFLIINDKDAVLDSIADEGSVTVTVLEVEIKS